MGAQSVTLAARVHTGPWEAFPRGVVSTARRLRRAVGDVNTARVRLYYLLDGRGRRLGVITAPEGRPVLGPEAPTVYLRRT